MFKNNKSGIFRIAVIAIVTIGIVFSLNGCFALDSEEETYKSDYWYTYKEFDSLKCQNSLIMQANFTAGSGRTVFVSYYPICKTCKEPMSLGNAATFDIDEQFSYGHKCSECGNTTIVRLKIS